MRLRRDDRAASQVIGAVLIFGVLIVALTTYQATMVPNQNREVEFRAYQSAQTDLSNFQNDIITAAVQGATTTSSIKTGASYQTRLFAVNPPTPTGRITTGPQRTVTFENVTAVDSESTNTRSFWSGTRTYTDITRSVLFRPQYREFDAQSVSVTGEAVYTIGDGRIAPLTGQSLLDGNRIRFVFLNGSVQAQGLRSSVTATPVSTDLNPVTITGNGNPLTIEFDPPAETAAGEWVGEFGERLRNTNTDVQSVSNVSGTIQLKLDGSKNYTLQLAQVELRSTDTSVDDHEPKYVVTHAGNDSVVDSGKRTTLFAQARDRFNNPVAGTPIEFEITQGDATLFDETGAELTGSTNEVTTDGNGIAPQKLRVDAIDTNVRVTARLTSVDGALNTTTFVVQTPAETNPVELAGVTFNGASKQGNNIDLEFENVVSEDREITKFRMDFYQGGSPQSGTFEGQSFDVGGSAVSLNPTLTIPASSTATFAVDFQGYNPSSGDWFIITIKYGTGDTAQYFGALE